MWLALQLPVSGLGLCRAERSGRLSHAQDRLGSGSRLRVQAASWALVGAPEGPGAGEQAVQREGGREDSESMAEVSRGGEEGVTK